MLKSVYGATKEIKHALTFKTSFYTVPKAAGAEVPPALFAKWVVPEEKVKQAAESGDVEFDFSGFWVVDQSCPREKLGMGVSTITLSLASSTRVQRDTGASSSAPQAHAPAPQAHAPAPQAPAEVPLAQGAAMQAQGDATAPQARENKVILDLIKNANIAAGMVLPGCQDTGTGLVMGKRGSHVLTDGRDEEHDEKSAKYVFKPSESGILQF